MVVLAPAASGEARFGKPAESPPDLVYEAICLYQRAKWTKLAEGALGKELNKSTSAFDGAYLNKIYLYLLDIELLRLEIYEDELPFDVAVIC